MFTDPAITIFLHGGEYDVACLKRDFNLALTSVFDTQQAASMLGYQQTGYGNVVETICDVPLAKEHSQYNWGERPIDQDALQYAIDDVIYLPRIAHHLQQQVTEADLQEEVAIANQAVMDAKGQVSGYDPRSVFRLKGVGKIHEKKLPLVVALHAWRDGVAQEENVPAGRIIANDALLPLAQAAPNNYGMLKKSRLRGAIMRTYGEEILQVVQQAKVDPPESTPAT